MAQLSPRDAPLVTVAAFGPSASAVFGDSVFEGPLLEDHDHEVPWDERLKVDLDVSHHETIADLIDRAAAEFGVTVPRHGPVGAGLKVSDLVAGVAFYDPQDDHFGGMPYPWLSRLPCINEDGALGICRLDEARYEDVVRAAGRGLIRGDPSRLYFYPTISQGGGFESYWPQLIDGLHEVLRAAKMLGELYAASEAIAAVKRRLHLAQTVPADELEARNLSPTALSDVLARTPWTVSELATALEVDEETASNIVLVLGFDISEDGAALRPRSSDGRFTRKLLRQLHGVHLEPIRETLTTL
jgi:hypothetical protein